MLSLPAETRTLPRSSSMAAGLERNGRTRVQAIFSHAAGDNSTLLSFSENDVITLLVPEARDGWHYGENEKTRMWVQLMYSKNVFIPPSLKIVQWLVFLSTLPQILLNLSHKIFLFITSGAPSFLPGAAGFPSPTPGWSLTVTATPWGNFEYTSMFVMEILLLSLKK